MLGLARGHPPGWLQKARCCWWGPTRPAGSPRPPWRPGSPASPRLARRTRPALHRVLWLGRASLVSSSVTGHVAGVQLQALAQCLPNITRRPPPASQGFWGDLWEWGLTRRVSVEKVPGKGV